MLLRCLALLLLVSVSFQGVDAAISVAVSPLVEVELGSPLVIPCTFNSSVGDEVVTQWFIISKSSRTRISYRDPRHFVADVGTGYESRIDARRSDSALALSATVAADERHFVCQALAGRAGVAEGTASVRLFSAPTVAVVATQMPVMLTQQQEQQRHHKIGECYVHNAYPEPLVTWYKASLPLWPSPDVKVTRKVVTEADGTFAVMSVLRYKLRWWDARAGYRCVVDYAVPGGRSESVASETIYVEVHYTPRGRVALILESHREAAVKEGDTVVLRCYADGFPPPEVEFYRSSPTRVDYGQAAAGDALTLPAVTRGGHSGTYGCRVTRGGGRDPPSGRVDLVVHDADDVELLGATEAARLTAGDVVEVASAAASSSSPAGIPTYTWTQAGTALSGGATLTLGSATPSKMGATSPPSVPGLGRSRPVKVAVGGQQGGGAEQAEASGRGLSWLIIILNLLLIFVPPLFLVFCTWALRHVCSREPQEVAIVVSERGR